MSFRHRIFWIRTGFCFLWRSGRSTTVLSLMVVVAVAALIFLSSLAVGVTDAMIRNSVGLYTGHISGFNLPLALKPEHLHVSGVAQVLKRIVIPGILKNADRIATIDMIGVDPAAELKTTAIAKKTVSGRYLPNDTASVFLSQVLAVKLDVHPGSTLRFDGVGSDQSTIELKVAGVYKTGIDHLDRGIAFCPRQLLPQKTRSWSAAVFLEDGVAPEAIITHYRRLLKTTAAFKSWQEMMPDLQQLIELNYVSMGIVMVLVFGVVSLGIACAFVIFILKNLREYGIMKAMGVTSPEMTLLILIEVILLNLAACAIGVGGGVLAVVLFSRAGIDLTAFTSYNRYFAVSGVIFPRLNFYSLFFPPALALFGSLAAAIWPAAIVARKKAADILGIV